MDSFEYNNNFNVNISFFFYYRTSVKKVYTLRKKDLPDAYKATEKHM